MKIRCYNPECRKDLSKWNVGRDGHAVLCDDCVARLLGGVPNSINKRERKEVIKKKIKTNQKLRRLK